jgi:hypothetical protein
MDATSDGQYSLRMDKGPADTSPWQCRYIPGRITGQVTRESGAGNSRQGRLPYRYRVIRKPLPANTVGFDTADARDVAFCRY